MSELKPCPFCGGEARTWKYSHPTLGEYWRVACNSDLSDCCISGRADTEAEAIAAWNTRAAMEFDNWFYLPKPREAVAEIANTVNSFDGEKWTVQQFFKVQEQAVINWAKELDEHIIRRICEVWSRADEKTCYSELDDCWECSECGFHDAYVKPGWYSYCPNCGAKVVSE